MILSFSGTGNSRYLAGLIAQALGDSLYSMNAGIKADSCPEIASDARLVFVVPTYAWRIPRIVDGWIRKHLSGRNPAWFVMTCGDDNGDAQTYAEALCRDVGLNYMGVFEIRMPENYIAMFNCPSEQEALKIVERAEHRLEDVIAAIRSGVPAPAKSITLPDRMKSGFVNDLFYRFGIKSKAFVSTDACIGCGKCADGCPTGSITLRDGRPVWDGSCTHCMACICGCPAEAIEYGKASLGKRRYLCPKASEGADTL